MKVNKVSTKSCLSRDESKLKFRKRLRWLIYNWLCVFRRPPAGIGLPIAQAITSTYGEVGW